MKFAIFIQIRIKTREIYANHVQQNPFIRVQFINNVMKIWFKHAMLSAVCNFKYENAVNFDAIIVAFRLFQLFHLFNAGNNQKNLKV